MKTVHFVSTERQNKDVKPLQYCPADVQPFPAVSPSSAPWPPASPALRRSWTRCCRWSAPCGRPCAEASRTLRAWLRDLRDCFRHTLSDRCRRVFPTLLSLNHLPRRSGPNCQNPLSRQTAMITIGVSYQYNTSTLVIYTWSWLNHIVWLRPSSRSYDYVGS